MTAKAFNPASVVSAHAFCRWAGGKARVVPALLEHIPQSWKDSNAAYHEPFVGGGALFWTLAQLYLESPIEAKRRGPRISTLSDTNATLMITYRVIRDQVDRLIARLADPLFADTEEAYYHIRSNVRLSASQGSSLSDADRAAHFLYLNKTCFSPGSLVLTANEKLLPIEKVQVGQKLWGGRKVLEKLQSRYDGQIFKIQATGVPQALAVTADHPILMIPGTPIGKRLEQRTANQFKDDIRLRTARELRVGDFLLTPRQGSVTRPIPWRQIWKSITVGPQAKKIRFHPAGNEVRLARLIGYYAAEGNLTRRYAVDKATSGVSFCFNSKAKKHIRDCVSIIKSVFPNSHVQVYSDPIVKRVTIAVTSVHIGRFFEKLVPGQSWSQDPEKRKTKHFADYWMTADPRLQLEVVKGWLRGDGSCRSKTSNSAELSGTCSVFTMAWQLYRMAMRCGLRPAWRYYHPGDVKMAVVSFCNLPEIHRLGFALDIPVTRVAPHRRIVGDYVASRIKNIQTTPYSGPVYNVEVDRDQLLCVDGVVSHNCYNGLYRVNKKGEFNVPYDGTPNRIGKRLICDAENLRACSSVLRNARPALFQQSFEEVLKHAEKGDLVYFDCPYVPVVSKEEAAKEKKSKNKAFTAYDERGFGPKDQTKLRDVALELKSKGVHVILSNADHPDVHALYQKRFKVSIIEVPRSINSQGTARGVVKELIIT